MKRPILRNVISFLSFLNSFQCLVYRSSFILLYFLRLNLSLLLLLVWLIPSSLCSRSSLDAHFSFERTICHFATFYPVFAIVSIQTAFNLRSKNQCVCLQYVGEKYSSYSHKHQLNESNPKIGRWAYISDQILLFLSEYTTAKEERRMNI